MTALIRASRFTLNKLAAAVGSSLSGHTPKEAGAVAKNVQQEINGKPVIHLSSFLTQAQIVDIENGNLVNDIKPALDLAIASAAAIGGNVLLMPGQLKLSAMVQMSSGVGLIGAGQYKGASATRQGVTSLWGAHTGSAVLSLKGCIACTVKDLSLEAGSGAIPKTGLLLGRSSAASAGYHKIISVAVYGWFSVAPVYTIASEDNLWMDLNVWLYAGGAKTCLYTGISDALGSGQSLVASSNLDNVFYRTFMVNSSTDADASCIFIQAAEAVGSWSFFGGYLTAYSGSYIQIDNGTIDGLSALGPFNFYGMNGEILSGGDPLFGVKLTATGTVTLPGLNIHGSRFAFLAGSNHYQFFQPGNLVLDSANIHIKPPEAFPYAQCVVQRAQNKNSVIQLGRVSEWQAITLSGNFANTYGAPYVQAEYCIDAHGVVRFQGTVTGSTGNICTLPVEYRPKGNMFFSVRANGASARVLITASTGVVSVSAGSGTELDLTGITYKIN